VIVFEPMPIIGKHHVDPSIRTPRSQGRVAGNSQGEDEQPSCQSTCTARPFQAYFVAKILVSRFAAKTRPAFRGLRRKPGQRFAICGGNPTRQILQARR
jgi:hypothetical protein